MLSNLWIRWREQFNDPSAKPTNLLFSYFFYPPSTAILVDVNVLKRMCYQTQSMADEVLLSFISSTTVGALDNCDYNWLCLPNTVHHYAGRASRLLLKTLPLVKSFDALSLHKKILQHWQLRLSFSCIHKQQDFVFYSQMRTLQE